MAGQISLEEICLPLICRQLTSLLKPDRPSRMPFESRKQRADCAHDERELSSRTCASDVIAAALRPPNSHRSAPPYRPKDIHTVQRNYSTDILQTYSSTTSLWFESHAPGRQTACSSWASTLRSSRRTRHSTHGERRDNLGLTYKKIWTLASGCGYSIRCISDSFPRWTKVVPG